MTRAKRSVTRSDKKCADNILGAVNDPDVAWLKIMEASRTTGAA